MWATASVRLRTPSLVSTLLTWCAAVLRLMCSRAAISGLLRPRATRWSTWRSRSVSSPDLADGRTWASHRASAGTPPRRRRRTWHRSDRTSRAPPPPRRGDRRAGAPPEPGPGRAEHAPPHAACRVVTKSRSAVSSHDCPSSTSFSRHRHMPRRTPPRAPRYRPNAGRWPGVPTLLPRSGPRRPRRVEDCARTSSASAGADPRCPWGAWASRRCSRAYRTRSVAARQPQRRRRELAREPGPR